MPAWKETEGGVPPLFTEIPLDREGQWFHHVWVFYILPQVKVQCGGAEAFSGAHIIRILVGVCAELPFLGLSTGAHPGKAFTKNRETCGGSIAGLLSWVSACPSMDLKFWRTNPTTQTADILQKKRPLSIWWPLCLLPARHEWTSSVRLPIRVGRSLLWPSGLIFPCGPVMLWGCGTHHSQSAMPIPICHLSQVCFTTGTWCALYLLIQHPETHLQHLIFAACSCPLESLPCHQMTAEPETSLVLFLVHLRTQPMVLLSLPERQYCCLE